MRRFIDFGLGGDGFDSAWEAVAVLGIAAAAMVWALLRLRC